jgi:hypothetical protein
MVSLDDSTYDKPNRVSINLQSFCSTKSELLSTNRNN